MEHKILVIHFSQSGQLGDILENFLVPFEGCDIDRIKVEPVEPFPFPWDMGKFFDVMPETVLEQPIELKPFTFKHNSYDLVVLGYQPWYMSPSLPTTSILELPEFKQVIKNTPVVTVIGARNMWLNAQESVKAKLHDTGGTLVANIPLIDRNPNLISAYTIIHWMTTGKKTKKYSFLPKPGISDMDIQESNEFGKLVAASLKTNTFENLQQQILGLGKIDIKTNILIIELRAKKLFNIWANLIRKKGTSPEKRKRWVSIFKYYLMFALFIVSPIVLIISTIIIRPFIIRGLKRKKEYFCSINLIR